MAIGGNLKGVAFPSKCPSLVANLDSICVLRATYVHKTQHCFIRGGKATTEKSGGDLDGKFHHLLMAPFCTKVKTEQDDG
jgi:hypothetical protein